MSYAAIRANASQIPPEQAPTRAAIPGYIKVTINSQQRHPQSSDAVSH